MEFNFFAILKNLDAIYRRDGQNSSLYAMNYTKCFPRNEDQQNLDRLARLLTDSYQDSTKGNICTALCINKGQLIIANNDGKYEHNRNSYFAKDTLRNLRSYSESDQANNDAENFFKKKCVKKLKDYKSSLEQFPNINNTLLLLKNFNISVSDYQTITNLRSNKNITQKEKKFLEEILEPMNDFRKVKEYLVSHQSFREIINDPSRHKFIEAQDLATEQYAREQAKDLHAEIKIAQYLEVNNPQGITSNIDLGINKLSCAGCYSLIKAIEDVSGIKFNIPGTHSQPFRYKKNINLVMSPDIIQRASKHLLSNIVFQESIEPEKKSDFFEKISSNLNLTNTSSEDVSSKLNSIRAQLKRFQSVKHNTNPEIQTSLRSSQTNSREFFLLNTQSVINEQNPQQTPSSEAILVTDSGIYNRHHDNQKENFKILERISPSTTKRFGQMSSILKNITNRNQSYVPPPRQPRNTSDVREVD